MINEPSDADDYRMLLLLQGSHHYKLCAEFQAWTANSHAWQNGEACIADVFFFCLGKNCDEIFMREFFEVFMALEI